MSPKHLLPCSCGNQIPVDLPQAGSRVRCTCGAELEVPTLLGLKRLTRADHDATTDAKTKPVWGTRQRLVFFGAILTVVGISGACWFFYTRPRIVDVADYPPWPALQLWESLKMGVDLPPSPVEKAMFALLKQHHQWTIAGLVLAAVGALIACASLLVRPQPRAKPPVS